MNERIQHYHRCPTPECEASWTCYRPDCDPHDACEDCEKRRFEDYHDRRGFTVSQPELEPIDALLVKD